VGLAPVGLEVVEGESALLEGLLEDGPDLGEVVVDEADVAEAIGLVAGDLELLVAEFGVDEGLEGVEVGEVAGVGGGRVAEGVGRGEDAGEDGLGLGVVAAVEVGHALAAEDLGAVGAPAGELAAVDAADG
jgi:hypothetical protein